MSKRLFDGDSRFMDFAAVTADYIGTGAIHVPVFESEIMDKTRKRGTLLQRVKTKPATGHPTRYFEKVAHENKYQFVDPRAIDHALNTAIDRVEHSALIKAMVDGITFTMFDKEVTNQQGLYGNLQAQDLAEVVTDMLDAQDRAVWTGAATSLMDNSSAGKAEYCSVLTQVTKTGTIAAEARLSEAIIHGVAALMYNKQYKATPTAIYMNPLDKARLDTQEMNEKDKVKTYDVEVLPGIVINGLMTAAGILPIITDVYCPQGKILITDENLLERQYVTDPNPRLFELEKSDTKTGAHDLADRYIAVLFDTFIVRGGSYGHMVLTIDGVSTDDKLDSSVVTIISTTESTTTAGSSSSSSVDGGSAGSAGTAGTAGTGGTGGTGGTSGTGGN